MKVTRLILSIGLVISLMSCSSGKSTSGSDKYHKIAVPAGTTTAVVFPAKKGKMSENELKSWPHADIYTDSVPGMSLAKAYDFLKGKKTSTVIVGIADSGIDINHEDLKDKIWINSKEVAGNGKDDDKNGFVDDMHGWNFLGGKKGESAPEQLELTRLVNKYNKKYAGKTESQIDPKDKTEYAYYLKLKETFDKKAKGVSASYTQYNMINEMVVGADKQAKEKLGKEIYTVKDLESLNDNKTYGVLMNILAQGGTVAEAEEQLEGIVEHYKNQADFNYNLDFNGRKTGDDPDDIKDVPYGNAFVCGSLDDEMHGTHVAGIALATRNNGKGMNGVASNVKLMVARAVPDGDEYDKDVALAIRYLVDNGAKVINMSFGKSYSPHAQWVYDAIKYAAGKDVLLVHAAGNDSSDIDSPLNDNYPTDSPDKKVDIADNVITIGSSTRHYNKKLVSSFSNYGKINVDIFAPGSEIYSTVPKSEYKFLQGTSMASPEVVGIAALIRSYYPQLSASQVKHIIMNSGTKADFDVILPGTKDKLAPFSTLSVSGRVVNAYNAVKMADQMVNGKK
jgi:subtilisin family serine protease